MKLYKLITLSLMLFAFSGLAENLIEHKYRTPDTEMEGDILVMNAKELIKKDKIKEAEKHLKLAIVVNPFFKWRHYVVPV